MTDTPTPPADPHTAHPDMSEEDHKIWHARERLAATAPALVEALVKLGEEYGPSGVLFTAQAIVDGWVKHLPDGPVCPACGATAELIGDQLQTRHSVDCAWMLDPDRKPYDQ